MTRILLPAAGLLLLAACATPGAPSQSVRSELAPKGVLRAAVNYGNQSLVQRDPAGGAAHGVAPDLARELARRLGVPIQYVSYETAGKVADDAPKDVWDVAFLAIDPTRAATIDFSDAYVEIGGAYLVRADSPLRKNADFDRKEVRIAISKGSGYDLFLSRALKNAQFVRTVDPPSAVDRFLADNLDAVAGIREFMEISAKTHPGLRVIDENFMVVRQAVALPKGHEAAKGYVHEFVEDMKRSGFVAASIKSSGSTDAAVAPPAK
jgi:polar amino acid transport system substrate-binding protein